MTPENEVSVASRLSRRRMNQDVAPSLRIAASIHNRALLRWMRAVESFAWRDAGMPRWPQSHAASKNIGVRSNLLETPEGQTL